MKSLSRSISSGVKNSVGNVLVFTGSIAALYILHLVDFIYYDDGMDSISTVFVSGMLSSSNNAFSISFATGKWLLLGQLIGILYEQIDGINWHGVVTIVLLATTTTVLYSIVKTHISPIRHKIPFLVYVLWFGLVFFFLENLILVQYTRIAFFLCFFGLIRELQKLESGEWHVLSIGNLLILIGTLIRFEAALLSLLLSTPFIIHLRLEGTMTKRKILTVVSLPAASVLFCFILMQIPGKLNDDIRVFNRFLHNADGNQYSTDNLNINNESDSLAYKITFFYFLNDPENINEEFIERIQLRSVTEFRTLFNLLTNVKRFKQKVSQDATKYLMDYRGLILFVLIVSIISIVLTTGNVHRMVKVAFILFYVLVFLGIVGFMKMENRVFSPYFTAVGILFVLSLDLGSKPKKSLGRLAILTMVAIPAASMILQGLFWKDQIAQRRISHSLFKQQLSNACKSVGSFLVLDVKSIYWYYSSPFQNPTNDCSKQYFSIDNGLYFLFPGYQETMKQSFNSSNILSFWQQVVENPNDFVFLSEGKRIRSVIEYFNNQYGLDLSVMKIDNDSSSRSIPASPLGQEVSVYRVTDQAKSLNSPSALLNK